MTAVMTRFSPSIHGFAFRNDFSVQLPVQYPLPSGGLLDINALSDGLCGGMCFGVLDYFYAGLQLPNETEPQKLDHGVVVYLCERHLESLKAPSVAKLIEWRWLEAKDRIFAMRRYEIPRLRRMLDKGQPVVLAIMPDHPVRDDKPIQMVVAAGYEVNEIDQLWKLTIYDPNHPRKESQLTFALFDTGFQATLASGEALLGIFVVPYKARKPSPGQPKRKKPVSFDLTPVPFKLHWPVDSRRVNQYFGENPESYKPFGLPGHEGVDLYALNGANIYAAADGEVVQADFPSNHPYGRQIRLKHLLGGKTVFTIYGHLSELLVNKGQMVSAGELIGKADNTGNSFGSHLHLTLKIDGAKTQGYPAGIVDPWPYLQDSLEEEPEPVTPLPPPSGIRVFTMMELNLRASPSTTARIIAGLPAGETLEVLGGADDVRSKIGKQDQWLQVRSASGQAGFVAAWFVQSTEQAFPPSGLVVYPFDQVNLRSGPGTGFDLLAALTLSDPLSVLGDANLARGKIGKMNEWLQVQTEKGLRGFVAAWLVHLTGQTAPDSGIKVYPMQMVNVRARPVLDGNILTVATSVDGLIVLGEKDVILSKIGQPDAWLNVRTKDRFTGYVAAWLVQLTEPAQPVTPPPAAITSLKAAATADVNMRAQPSSNSPRVSGLFANEIARVLEPDLASARQKIGKMDQWIYLEKSSGERGWVAAWYLRQVV